MDKILYFQYLSIHSPVFAAMFFGNFEENGKEEVAINEIDYEVQKSPLLRAV